MNEQDFCPIHHQVYDVKDGCDECQYDLEDDCFEAVEQVLEK